MGVRRDSRVTAELINRIAQLAIDRRQQILSIKKKRKKKAVPAAKKATEKDQEKPEKKAAKPKE